MAHLHKADNMIIEKRDPYDVYCQLRAVEGSIQKIIYKFFDEALRKDLIVHINRLLEGDKLCDKQAETLADIREKIIRFAHYSVFSFLFLHKFSATLFIPVKYTDEINTGNQ